MLLGAREAGCFSEVAALHSDHYRQVPLYTLYCTFSAYIPCYYAEARDANSAGIEVYRHNHCVVYWVFYPFIHVPSSFVGIPSGAV